MTWQRGTGLLGPMEPLIGAWNVFDVSGSTAASGMSCTRSFERLGSGWIELHARWQAGAQVSYHELAVFGPVEPGVLGFHSFTSDGQQSRGQRLEPVPAPALSAPRRRIAPLEARRSRPQEPAWR